MDMEIGHRIAKLRNRMGLSQRDVARAIGVSFGLVGQWESHKKKPGRETLARLAQKTGVSMDYLMGVTPDLSMALTVTDPFEVSLVLRSRSLTARQRKNLGELLDMTLQVRREIEQERSPAEAEEAAN